MESGVAANKPIVLFGAGRKGKEALDYYGRRNVHFFEDNYKAGLYYCGLPVISAKDLQRIHRDYQIIISTMPVYFYEIQNQLECAGIRGAVLYKPDHEITYVKNPRLEAFKNAHKGKRCFLIGNGPSLRAEDLDKIAQNGCSSFASNKIYKIYGKTHWRPDYYFASDGQIIIQNWDMISSIKENKFLAYTEECISHDMLCKLIGKENVYLFRSRYLQYDPNNKVLLPVYEPLREPYPSFSQDAARFVYEGFSVTYLMMQWAAYMGFSEIFLLGVDHHFAHTCNYLDQAIPPQAISVANINDHFCDDYHKPGESIYIADVNSNDLAFRKAEQYSREHGFRIYNATRGGKLEVFERVDFDSLFI